jgi:carbonic anhydrase/acetyltransferase-like protein (isoleucine patch superfamily)
MVEVEPGAVGMGDAGAVAVGERSRLLKRVRCEEGGGSF